MNRVILSLALASMVPALDNPWSIEGYAMGFSHHTNRSLDYNEKNWGGGLGVAYLDANPGGNPFSIEPNFIIGTYLDSYREHARYAMPGIRVVFGDREKVHFTIGLNAGYFVGSDFKGFGAMPTAGLGYNRVDICMTGSPPTDSYDENSKNPSKDPKDHRHASSGFVACFLKIRLVEW